MCPCKQCTANRPLCSETHSIFWQLPVQLRCLLQNLFAHAHLPSCIKDARLSSSFYGAGEKEEGTNHCTVQLSFSQSPATKNYCLCTELITGNIAGPHESKVHALSLCTCHLKGDGFSCILVGGGSHEYHTRSPAPDTPPAQSPLEQLTLLEHLGHPFYQESQKYIPVKPPTFH